MLDSNFLVLTLSSKGPLSRYAELIVEYFCLKYFCTLLGYAGSPLLLVVPCLIFSFVTAVRIFKVPKSAHMDLEAATNPELVTSGGTIIQLPVRKVMSQTSDGLGEPMTESTAGVRWSDAVNDEKCSHLMSRTTNSTSSIRDDSETRQEMSCAELHDPPLDPPIVGVGDGVHDQESMASNCLPTFALPSNEEIEAYDELTYDYASPNSCTIRDDSIIRQTLGHRDSKSTAPKWARISGLSDNPERAKTIPKENEGRMSVFLICSLSKEKAKLPFRVFTTGTLEGIDQFSTYSVAIGIIPSMLHFLPFTGGPN
jgi:hypothetical protein